MVCGHERADSLSAARKRSMSGTRSLSCRIQGEGMRSSPSSTSRMCPVRPMPPSVARNRSLSRSREQSRMRPSATRRRSARTWRPKRAGHVVVLAVHVGRHHAAQGDELRARRDGAVEAARQQQPVHGPQRQAGLGAQDAGLRVEGRDAVGQRRRGHAALRRRRQRRVAVGARQAARQHGVAGQALEVLGALLVAGDGDQAPARDARLAVLHRGRSTSGKLRQTGTPQKCSPSVQVGVMRRWRSTQGGPMCRARRGCTVRSCSSSSIDAR